MPTPKTQRYEGVLSELLRCCTVKEMMSVLRAHIEQVDEGMLAAVLDDDRFDDFFFPRLIVGVLMSKGIYVDLKAFVARRR